MLNHSNIEQQTVHILQQG